MIHHLHFNEIASTQNYLKEHLQDLVQIHSKVLISTNRQTDGHGRRGHKWEHFSNGLAFSFTLLPSEIVTLTPLELATLSYIFFLNKYNLSLELKWPNDLLYLNKKCGGIICQLSSEQVVIAGIGINLGFLTENHSFEYQHGHLLNESTTLKQKESIPEELVSFIHLSRLQKDEIKSLFNSHCAHIGKPVSIKDNNDISKGIFIGIGDCGEAILEISPGVTKKFYSGSLRY